MANRNWSSHGKIYSGHTLPVLVDCNFIVDSTNGNGLGIRSLKGPVVQNVFMHTTASPGLGNSNPATPNVPVRNPNPMGSTGGAPVGSPNLASASTYAILAYAAITGSTGAGSTVHGDMGIYPNNATSVTNFPPSTYTGVLNAANSLSNQAMIDATAAYTDLTTRTATPISATLDGQTLTPGVYTESSGTFHLASSGNGTLTLNGAGVYVFHCASTLSTGAGGIPTVTFTGGASAANVYWVCGSSATINIGVTSAGATFPGTVIAQASVTATQAGTILGRLIALTGAVTLSDTNNITVQANSATGGGAIVVQLEDNYNRSISGFSAIVTPVSGTPIIVASAGTVAGTAYIIVDPGTTTTADWQSLGVPKGVTPAVGVSFVATITATRTGTGVLMTTAPLGSNVITIETVGNPNLSIAPDLSKNQGFGAQFILQCRNSSGAPAAPADGTVISLGFLLDNSSNRLQGG